MTHAEKLRAAAAVLDERTLQMRAIGDIATSYGRNEVAETAEKLAAFTETASDVFSEQAYHLECYPHLEPDQNILAMAELALAQQKETPRE